MAVEKDAVSTGVPRACCDCALQMAVPPPSLAPGAGLPPWHLDQRQNWGEAGWVC